MNALKIVALTIALTSCKPDVTLPMASTTNDRVSVHRIAVFEDELAYDGKRGVYLIVDTKTGREYVGVSGVGIAEVGNHSTGKARRTDER